jgi:transposase
MVTVTQKQLQRLKVIENAVEGKLTAGEAAALLGVSIRQVKRYKARFQPKDPVWVLHGNTGRKPANRCPEAIREQIAEMAKGKYKGFNDRHLHEKLVTMYAAFCARSRSARRRRGAPVNTVPGASARR